jgi:hypothetical protein
LLRNAQKRHKKGVFCPTSNSLRTAKGGGGGGLRTSQSDGDGERRKPNSSHQMLSSRPLSIILN